jgi:hypothetical protein
MHTSWTVFLMWGAGMGMAVIAQVMNFYSSPKPRSRLRWGGLVVGILATSLAGGAAFKGAIDWLTVPLSADGLSPGMIYDNGATVAVVENAERRAVQELQQRAILEQIEKARRPRGE